MRVSRNAWGWGSVGKKDEGKLLDNTNMEDVCVCVFVSFEGLCLCACVLQYV